MSKSIGPALCLVCTFFLVWGSPGARGEEKADWPCWRGADQDGISKETNWDPQAVNKPKIVWRRNVGFGPSSVVIQGDCLYAQGNVGEGPHVKEVRVRCLELKTGREKWGYGYPPDPKIGNVPSSTPTVDDGLVYVFSNVGTLYCLNAETGEERWKQDCVKAFQAQAPEWMFASSPCIEGDLVILNACRSGLALHKKSGKRKWASAKGKCGYATPVIVEKGKKKYAAIFGEKHLYLVSVKTGRVLISHMWVTQYYVNAADPVVYKNTIFITSGYKKGCALISLKSGAKLWENESLCGVFPTPIILDGNIYGVSGQSNYNTSFLKCLDLKTGRERWCAPPGFGTLTASEGKLIFLSSKGELMVVKADPSSYQVIAKCNLNEGRKRAVGYWGVPVLCRGRLYCRNRSGGLSCFDLSKK
ncbi:MAG: PQQ-binding-like beta-propeller repeat protein [Planctomycetota bacterium]|jgi:outer membrane protein assembly factor BamB